MFTVLNVINTSFCQIVRCPETKNAAMCEWAIIEKLFSLHTNSSVIGINTEIYMNENTVTVTNLWVQWECKVKKYTSTVTISVFRPRWMCHWCKISYWIIIIHSFNFSNVLHIKRHWYNSMALVLLPWIPWDNRLTNKQLVVYFIRMSNCCHSQTIDIAYCNITNVWARTILQSQKYIREDFN